jgi:DNA polymerase
VRIIGPRAVRLYPLYHPAAALYTGSTLEALRADFQRIPELLALGAPPQPEPVPELPEIEIEPEPLESDQLTAPEPAPQLGLF